MPRTVGARNRPNVEKEVVSQSAEGTFVRVPFTVSRTKKDGTVVTKTYYQTQFRKGYSEMTEKVKLRKYIKSNLKYMSLEVLKSLSSTIEEERQPRKNQDDEDETIELEEAQTPVSENEEDE